MMNVNYLDTGSGAIRQDELRDWSQAALNQLDKAYGYGSFRPGQLEAVNTILNGRDLVAVMPTGSGKSVCYQLPAMRAGHLTLVVSPLRALMRDQVQALQARGVAAALIDSGVTPKRRRSIYDMAHGGGLRILYVAPGAPALRRFRRFHPIRPRGPHRHRRGALRAPMGTRLPPKLHAHRRIHRTAAHTPRRRRFHRDRDETTGPGNRPGSRTRPAGHDRHGLRPSQHPVRRDRTQTVRAQEIHHEVGQDPRGKRHRLLHHHPPVRRTLRDACRTPASKPKRSTRHCPTRRRPASRTDSSPDRHA